MPASKVYAFGPPENDGERRVIRFLQQHLPDGYRIYHTMERAAAGQTYEWDVLVLAPHALFCLEVKDWPGRIAGNDRDWMLDTGALRRNPYPLIAKKARILASLLRARDPFLDGVWVEPLVVIADEQTQLALRGECAAYTVTLRDVISRLTDTRGHRWEGRDIRALTDRVERALTDGYRPVAKAREVAHFRLLEQIEAGDLYTEWRAENRFSSESPPVRLKIYAPDPYAPREVREQQLRLVRRDFEAAARLGTHPHLRTARDFFPEEGGRFVLVLEDLPGKPLSATLFSGDELTFERKLEIAQDVAAGLTHAHARKVIHRDVRPGNIWLTPGGAVLTNFDCARMGDGQSMGTVGEQVQANLEPPYLAPEVRGNAASASEASDVFGLGAVLYELLTGEPPALERPVAPPSAADPLVESELDELVLRMVSPEAAMRPSAAEAGDILVAMRERRRAGTQEPVAVPPDEDGGTLGFSTGDTIDGQYLVREVLGEGTFGSVYRVYHAVSDREYAMKIFRTPGVGLEDARREFATLADLQHPRIARVWHAGLLRHSQEGALAQYFLLTDYVAGQPLQRLLETQRPAPVEAVRIICDVLRALEYMHSRQFVHRDIKPSNLVVSPDGAWLIDFNIAASAAHDEPAGAGTPRYAPPDVATCAAQPSRDLFAAGVVLYELLTGVHPYEGRPLPGRAPRNPLDDQPRLTQAMAGVLRRAVAPQSADRFATASEFLAALGTIEEPLLPDPPTESAGKEIDIPPEEWAIPNYNPYLTRFIALYSQNRTDNSGTRGYDQVSRATYVRTRLDTRLIPDIVAGRYRLVIVSGNAGDGKTAFLQSLEERLERGFEGRPQATVTRLPSGNGAVFSLDGCTYRTNYDGSQDESGRQNDDVLADFFAPFGGPAEAIAARAAGEARLIAINEGKLRDFLARRRQEFPWLASEVEAFLDRGQPLPDGYLLVNLNDRSVVAGGADNPSIVDQQIRALCDPEFWAACRDCALLDRCPARFNADTMNHPDLGPRVRARVERLFLVAHLRNRTHLTMRSVRSALAYLLFRDATCRDIAAELEGSDATPDRDERLLRSYYYNALALDTPPEADDAGGRPEVDRLLQLLAESDVGIGANPRDDRDLHFQGVASPLLPVSGGRADYDRDLLRAWGERLQAAPDDPETQASHRRRHAVLRRKAFFERPDAGWEAMLPYAVLGDMHLAIRGDAKALERLKLAIVRGINQGEGLAGVEDTVLLRVAHGVPGTVRSYRQFPVPEFVLQPANGLTVSRYVEASPASLALVYRPGGNGAIDRRPTLRLSLDLVELLARMARGYAPTAAEARGALVNLLVFRALLAHEPYDRLLLVDTTQERRFRVQKQDARISLTQESDAAGRAASPPTAAR
jgi:serine/threonine protein kinase